MGDFVRNTTNRSNTSGHQFEFHCDRCGKGQLAAFKPTGTDAAKNLLKAAESFFAGPLPQASSGEPSADGGRDEAYKEAVSAAKAWFKHCDQCGLWVCPTACWNETRQQCGACAGSAKARDQGWSSIRATDQHAALKLAPPQLCPHCNAQISGGKFCIECGEPLAPANATCSGCGTELQPQAKFCADCGTARR